MMLQIQSSDQWSYYQEKGLKATLLASKIELLEVLDRPVPPTEKDKIRVDLDKQAATKTEAETKEREAGHLFRERGVLLGGHRISNRHLPFRHLAPHKTPGILAPRARLRRHWSLPAHFWFSQVKPAPL